MLGEFIDLDDPLNVIRKTVSCLNSELPFWWQDRDKDLIETLLYPATDSVDEWAREIVALHQIVVEGFADKGLRNVILNNNGQFDKEWRSLKLVEAYLGTIGLENSTAKLTVAPLRELHELRNNVGAHSSPSRKREMVSAARKEHQDLQSHFRYLAKQVAEALVSICDYLTQKA